ncbi:hypothetical protein UG55_103510 [Frankia sp. EI5c]|uniref:hypothetical protein n=1 Tax=Frankia sp. EI5c TaxID=683316 RepID=UPI0007C208B8|nr:hypothetical protein [Frankia sp. EI5c]OAA23576.1 hypothetical protein UG55_103510 [Frankia sp. EI5c]
MAAVTDVGTLLISMPEIADLADVQRAVVTTWRRRHPDFPAPVTGPGLDASIPMFHAPDVLRWLAANPRRGNRQVETADLRLYLLRCLGQRLGARPLLAAASALLCLRHLDDEPLAPAVAPGGVAGDGLIAALRARAEQADPRDELLLSEVRALGAEADWLAPAVDELVEAAYNTRDAFGRLLAARHRLGVPELCADAVVPRLAALMAQLSGAPERARETGSVEVADPAAGAGDLLAAVHAAVGEDYEVRLRGIVPDRFLARLARRRFTVAGLARRDVDIRATAATRRAATRGAGPDAVVSCLPFQPAEERDAVAVLAAVRGLADTLRPGQTAVLLGPAEALVDPLPVHRPAVRRRDELLTTGLVEAVISLPGGMVPFRPGYRTALWVLRHERDTPARGRVLLADLSDRELTDDLVDTLVLDVVTWRRDGFAPDQRSRALTSQASIQDLKARPGAAPMALTAPRPAGEPTRRAARAVVRLREIEDEVTALAGAGLAGAGAGAGARPAAGALVAMRDDPRALPTAAIGRLASTTATGGGLLRLLPGTRIAPGDVRPASAGHHPLVGAQELSGASRFDSRKVDRVVLADAYPRARLTEPGDIVVTTSPRFGVHLDEPGSSIIEFPARGLRLTDAGRAVLTPRVLAALLVAAAPTGRTPGAVRAPRRLEDLYIAALPEPVVRDLDTLLAATDARRGRLRRELDLLDELRRTTVNGLADGTLTLIAAPAEQNRGAPAEPAGH